jgi:hypothetical protein
MRELNIENYNLHLKPLKGKKWELVEDFEWALSNGDIIRIPAGTITDLSSVPRFLWYPFSPYGDFLIAAIVHDYLYISKHREGRKFADKEMLIISNRFNNSSVFKRVDNKLRYRAVRLFGWYYWRYKDFQGN